MTGIMRDFIADPKLKNAVGAKNRIPGMSWIRSLSDEDFAAFRARIGQDFDQYRIAVTGAGAGPTELNMLEKNRPTERDTKEAFIKKYVDLIKIGERQRERKLRTWEAVRFDTGDLRAIGQAEGTGRKATIAEAQKFIGGQAPGPQIRTARINGQLVQGTIDESGNFVPLQTPAAKAPTTIQPGQFFNPLQKPE